MDKMPAYISKIREITEKVEKTQAAVMNSASEAIADTLLKEGTVYTFGTGHSHLLAEEIFYRAGGLVKVYPILDEPLMLHTGASRSSLMERLPGYADVLIENNLGIKPGDVMLIFSNSGRNTVSIEMALAAKRKGMTVIGITNMAHSRSTASRHRSGRRLYEICDIVIDNCGEAGDACIPIGNVVCGPTSTVIGSMILQAVVCGAVERLTGKPGQPEVFSSGNIDGGDERNKKYIEKYQSLIKLL